ncbi:phage tail protein [Salmonella enterica]|nr:phage tail protein [Salmonella enterica]
MTQSVITSAFEHLKAQEAAGGNRILIDQFVFANIPGLNVTDTPPESEPLPPDAQIVHCQNIDRNGMVNENTVAYSVTLPESVGDFTFNWLGLVSSATNTLCQIVYLHPQEKIKTANGKQGNTLVYSEIMEYAGASAATGITTPVSTWQIDFTARLHGMDEATRKAALDIYGPGLFFNDAFKLTAQATGQATFAPGIAYLRGLRVELDVPGTLTYSTGISQTVYIDAALTGTLTGENKATFSLTSQKSADYIDSLGFAHYVEPVATISASGEITDIRKTRKPLNDRLDGEYLTRDGSLKEIADKGERAQSDAREHMGLGNSATRNVGTTPGTVAAGDDSRITGAMQKNQNGADIPDKAAFIEHIGMKETINPTKRVSIGNTGSGAFDGSTPCINIGDSDSGFIGSADGVIDIYCNNARVGYIDNNGLHMLTDIHFDNARMTTNGDIFSSVWGGNWLSIWITNQLNTRGTIDWINGELAIRDNNINTRATWDYVNQTFARKNTASLATNGWFSDASTGWIYQWGITPFAGNTTITVDLPVPFPRQGFMAMGNPASALWYGDDDTSGSAALLNNSQLRVTTDNGLPTAWIAIGY